MRADAFATQQAQMPQAAQPLLHNVRLHVLVAVYASALHFSVASPGPLTAWLSLSWTECTAAAVEQRWSRQLGRKGAQRDCVQRSQTTAVLPAGWCTGLTHVCLTPPACRPCPRLRGPEGQHICCDWNDPSPWAPRACPVGVAFWERVTRVQDGCSYCCWSCYAGIAHDCHGGSKHTLP
jgi:hypothetical protein